MFGKKMIFAGFIIGACLFAVVGCSNKEEVITETETSNIFVAGDTVSEQLGCVLSSRFTVGDKIVFRMNAKDPITNEQIKDAELTVKLSTGEELEMEYGPHSDDEDGSFWTAAYPITEETPTGTLEYSVTAEHGDSKGEFKPFNVAPSLVTIVAPEAMNGEQPAEEAAEETNAEVSNVETN